jgi:hypothetical protein
VPIVVALRVGWRSLNGPWRHSASRSKPVTFLKSHGQRDDPDKKTPITDRGLRNSFYRRAAANTRQDDVHIHTGGRPHLALKWLLTRWQVANFVGSGTIQSRSVSIFVKWLPIPQNGELS